jgi:hypothetical protein
MLARRTSSDSPRARPMEIEADGMLTMMETMSRQQEEDWCAWRRVGFERGYGDGDDDE